MTRDMAKAEARAARPALRVGGAPTDRVGRSRDLGYQERPRNPDPQRGGGEVDAKPKSNGNATAEKQKTRAE